MNLNLNQFLRFPQSRIGRYLTQVTLVAIAYAVGARLAFAIQGVNPFASSVWPPAGIAQAGLLLFGPKAWPAIVLGIFFLNLVNPSEQIFAIWVGGNVGAVLQAVFAATVLRWLGFRPSLERLKDVVNLILLGGLVSTQISCTIGAFSIYLAGQVDWAEYWSLRWNWWLGDAMGVLILTPLILIFLRPKATADRLKRQTELPKNYLIWRGVWLILLIGVSWLVFESKNEASISRYPLEYLPFPLIIWASLQFGQRAAVLGSFIVSSIAIFGSSHGSGPFIAKAENISQAILFLQAFMAVVTITSLLLAATVAERAEAEKSLRVSEIKYRELVENANSIIVKLAPDGTITFFNEFAEIFFGYNQEEILGKSAVGTIIPMSDIEGNNLELVYNQILQNPDRFTSYENENIRRNGSRVWVSWANKPLVDAAGELLGILCIGTDITDRRKAEIELQKLNEKLEIRVAERTNALKQSELQLQKQKSALIDLAKNKALNQGDLTKALQEITETASRTLEVARSSIWLYDRPKSKMECLDLFDRALNQHSDGLELSAADYPVYFQALREERAIAAFDAQKDFRTREFVESYLIPFGITSMLDTPIQIGPETAGVLCLEHVGMPRYWTIEEQSFAVSLTDSVTFAMEARERQRAEAALRQAEAKYRSIFENAIVGIFQTTPDGEYLSVNPALIRIYGYSSCEEMLEKLTDINRQLYVDPERRAEIIELMRKNGKVSDFESQVYRQGGSIIWIAENAYTVSDRHGNLLYYEGTVQDITTRKEAEAALRLEQEKSDRLLLNVLPKPIAERLKQDQSIIADTFAEVTVLFADIVGFTQISAQISPPELVSLLNDIFSTFDRLAQKHGLEKIKTIGDAYMVVGGLPMPRSDHAEAIAQMALDMQQAIIDFSNTNNQDFSIRIGINSGPVVAGVIGIKKFIYDLWGDTVNTASRMESHGLPGQIQVTSATYERLQDKYLLESRGTIEVKGKGEMNTYFITGIKL
ncbi:MULTISPECIES: adenylate/guanylate cyclase domain-containing protein [unclassified Microcoleus]|uniref:adenylate/guanylate cyclase domain-containing protein n=1 Tax=unclassified Microcoleus TaxID=2642155 RepID=UPI0025F4EFB7|nr:MULTISPECIES: adenylate/guanylate cyclase domain-containing protein [unclassified Microcoleus]